MRVRWAYTRLRNLEATALDRTGGLYVLQCWTLTIDFMCLRYPAPVVHFKLIIDLMHSAESGTPDSGLRCTKLERDLVMLVHSRGQGPDGGNPSRDAGFSARFNVM